MLGRQYRLTINKATVWGFEVTAHLMKHHREVRGPLEGGGFPVGP